MEDYLNFLLNGRQPQFLLNGKQSNFFKLKTTLVFFQKKDNLTKLKNGIQTRNKIKMQF